MELLVILALLASNLFLIVRVLKKPDAKTDKEPPQTENPPLSPEASVEDDDDLVGRSHVDMERINALIDAKVEAANTKVNARIDRISHVVSELTRPEDVGMPPEENGKQALSTPTVPQEKLDEVFTHHTVSESFGETPEPQEPVTATPDFKALESAVRVAKDEPHTPEEAAAAKQTLKEIEGTQLGDRIALDPKVRTRILTIVYGDEDEELSKEVIAKKKVVFSKTIDTFDVDRINLNILS